MKSARQFLRFCAVGVVGFIVDGGGVQILAWLGVNVYLGRVISFLLAASATWLLNRRYTFRVTHTAARHREWLRYVVVTSVGAGVNYGVYALCLMLLPSVRQWPILGVAAGSGAALGLNFATAKYLLFRPKTC